jgi:hypothetical protein
MAGASGILGLLICTLFAKDAFDVYVVPHGDYGAYDPPSVTPAGFLFNILLLIGSVLALWKGRVWILALLWLVVICVSLINFWIMWRAHPLAISWDPAPPFLLGVLGFGLAFAGRSGLRRTTNSELG